MDFAPISDQDKLAECCLMCFSHKMPDLDFIFLGVDLMISRLKFFSDKRKQEGPFNLELWY